LSEGAQLEEIALNHDLGGDGTFDDPKVPEL